MDLSKATRRGWWVPSSNKNCRKYNYRVSQIKTPIYLPKHKAEINLLHLADLLNLLIQHKRHFKLINFLAAIESSPQKHTHYRLEQIES